MQRSQDQDDRKETGAPKQPVKNPTPPHRFTDWADL